ncbi:hypothetical protein [Megasphaera sp.]|uniref:phage baseplate protein n=1 Tax=Megasphaera sp. TaxID=2023260 RepID=UPI00307FA280
MTKTVKEIITTMKTAIDNLNTDVSSNKTAIDNLNTDVSSNKTAIDNLKGQILQAVYPVGSVYVSITDSRNPADILGFGTWEALPAGYGLVAQGTATAEDGSKLTFTAGQKSGEFKHQITVGELPSISAKVPTAAYVTTPIDPQQRWSVTATCVPNNDTFSGQYIWASLDGAGNRHHNNISPVVACYCWRRTA